MSGITFRQSVQTTELRMPLSRARAMFPIQKLPIEIRDMIFASVIQDADNSKRHCLFELAEDGYGFWSSGLYDPLLALSQTCKEYRDILSPALYKDVSFTFSNCGDDFFYTGPGKMLPIPKGVQFQHVTKVKIIVGIAAKFEKTLKGLMSSLSKGKNLTDCSFVFRAGMWKGWAYARMNDVYAMWPTFRVEGDIYFEDDNEFRDWNMQTLMDLEHARQKKMKAKALRKAVDETNQPASPPPSDIASSNVNSQPASATHRDNSRQDSSQICAKAEHEDDKLKSSISDDGQGHFWTAYYDRRAEAMDRCSAEEKAALPYRKQRFTSFYKLCRGYGDLPGECDCDDCEAALEAEEECDEEYGVLNEGEDEGKDEGEVAYDSEDGNGDGDAMESKETDTEEVGDAVGDDGRDDEVNDEDVGA